MYPPVMEIEQSHEIVWMLRHWWYGTIPPWTAFPQLSLCKILPLCIYFTFFGIKYLLNGLCFLCCWYSVIIFLVFMYSVCIVNIFRDFSPFFWFTVKLWYFTLLHFKGIPFPLDLAGGGHVQLFQRLKVFQLYFASPDVV